MTTPDDLAGGLIPHAIRAIGEGLSANAWIRAVAASGAGIRRQVALRVYGEAKRIAAEYGQEPTRPLDQVPSTSEQPPWETRSSTGVLQTVQLVYRERVTGNLVTRFYNVKNAEAITRGQAVQQAIDANSANAGRYQQTLVSAFHTGAVQLVAREAA